jgi:cyclase
VSIDYRQDIDGVNYVWTNNGRVKTQWKLESWVAEAEKLGAGELLLTSIDRDGSCQGLDINSIRAITDNTSIPIVMSGGSGTAAHFIDGFNIANASAIAAGTFFCFKDQNPMQTRAHIKNANVPIRIQS